MSAIDQFIEWHMESVAATARLFSGSPFARAAFVVLCMVLALPWCLLLIAGIPVVWIVCGFQDAARKTPAATEESKNDG